jgi:uncharacterized protein
MNHLKRSNALTIIELCILLILPLPFLKLNALYVILALVIVLASKYMRKEKWTDYGFSAIRKKELFLAIAIGIVFGFVDNFMTEPLITKLTGSEPDLSSYQGVKGSLKGLIGMLALGWIVGGLFEEFFFRGYLFYRFNMFIHNPGMHKWVTIAITSVVFGFAHNYQGVGGIIGTLFFAVVMGLLYFYFHKNTWYLILVHGFYDTVGIFRLYLGQ